MLTLFAILIIVFGLSFLILAHEAGHFFMAKFFKLKVDEFGFGFPPRIFAWRPGGKKKGTLRQTQAIRGSEEPAGSRRGETEYSFNWLPFGGFVRIAGEDDRLENQGDASRVEEGNRLFYTQPAWRRSAIILAGVTVNFLLGWWLLSLVFSIGTPPAVVVTDTQEGSPAAAVGLMPGDVIKGYLHVEDFIQFINENRGEAIEVAILRGGRDLTFTVTPRQEVKEDEGALGVILTEAGVPKQPLLSALGSGFTGTMKIAGLTFVGFYNLLKDLLLRGTLAENIVGPVGIFSVAHGVGRIGLIYLFQLLAIISVNLAVINLLPFPALDGGRFFMILIEKIRGSPISRRTEAFINTVGFIFLIVLMAIVTIRDIVNLTF